MNTYRPLFKLFVLYIAVQLALSGCVGASVAHPIAGNPSALQGGVDALQPGSTIWGVLRCFDGATGTSIYSDGANKFLFVWQLGGRYSAFWGLDAANKIGIELQDDILQGGQVAGYNSIKSLTDDIEKLGFQRTAPETMPLEIKTAIGQAQSWLTLLMKVRLPVILLVSPAGMLEQIGPCALPEYQYSEPCQSIEGGGVSQ